MNLELPGLYMICGLQGGGKSHLIRYIMYQNRARFDCGIVFTNTGFVDGNFDYVDKRFVHLQYNEQVLKNLKEIFKKQIESGKHPRGYVIFDDCISGKQWRSPELISLVTQVRHYNITVIISTQYPKAILPMYHANTFKVLMFHMASKAAMMALYEAYGQMLGTFEEFKAFYIAATSPKYQFLVYDARNGGATIESRYLVAKAPQTIPKFSVGENRDK